jgi:serine protease Do
MLGDASTIAQQNLAIGGNQANFGVHRIQGGFTPDPKRINVVSGGNINVANLGHGNCNGFATRQPDAIVHYSNPAGFLRFFVVAQGDTTLVVNDPNSNWVCNDDAVGTNPMVDMNRPAAGQYDIWIGSYESGSQLRGNLYITELQGQSPSNNR